MLLISSITFAQSSLVKMTATAVCFKFEGEDWTNREHLTTVNIYLTDTYMTISSAESQYYKFTSTTSEDVIDGNTVIASYATNANDIACYVRIVIRKSGLWQIYIDFSDVTICYDVKIKNEI